MWDQVRDVRHLGPNALAIDIVVPSRPKLWRGYLQSTSDIHLDHQKCRRDILKNHLAIGEEFDAIWKDGGDLFCVMQMKRDPRSSKNSLREEYKADNYLDLVCDDAYKILGPHCQRLVSMGMGNHEVSPLDRHGTNLTARLCERFRENYEDCHVLASGYTTFLTLRFHCGKDVCPIRIWQIHGYGGGGPVTKDLIQLNRQLCYIDNADIMLSGHTHDSWSVPFERIGFNKDGRPVRRTGLALKTPSMKDEYGDGRGGWTVEKGMPPKPLGSYLIQFRWDNDTRRAHFKPIPLDPFDKPGSLVM